MAYNFAGQLRDGFAVSPMLMSYQQTQFQSLHWVTQDRISNWKLRLSEFIKFSIISRAGVRSTQKRRSRRHSYQQRWQGELRDLWWLWCAIHYFFLSYVFDSALTDGQCDPCEQISSNRYYWINWFSIANIEMLAVSSTRCLHILE